MNCQTYQQINKLASAIALDNGLINRYCDSATITDTTYEWMKDQPLHKILLMEKYLSRFNDEEITLIASDPESEVSAHFPEDLSDMADALFEYLSIHAE